MSKKRKRTLVYTLISIILTLIIMICVFIIAKSLIADSKASDEVKKVYNIIRETSDEESGFTQESFRAILAENKDFIGYIAWDSGIIEQPILQAADNDYYLHRSFDGNYYESGSIFMDSESKLSDQNIVIYGHNNSYNHEIMFSHLNDMALDQEYYENNSRFTVFLENEVREYAICYVYYINEEEFEDYDFLQANFESREEFASFMEFPEKKNLISSVNGELEYGNRFVTLQTCKRMNQDVKVVVLAKEVLVRKYKN
ncbi:MAG: class B sortase [Erysipelotrichaceae bacterium]|nr:class B sortase [Erysipelotrichaceae bacterium]